MSPDELSNISTALQDSWKWSRVIRREGDAEPWQTGNTGWYFLENLILRIGHYFPTLFQIFPEHYTQENRAAIDHFQRLFGQRRVSRISERYNLDLGDRWEHGLSLTVGDLHKLFVAVADVRKEDVVELFNEVQSAAGGALATGVRHLTPAQTVQLHAAFGGRAVDQLTKADYDNLCAVLVPFKAIEEIFFHTILDTRFERLQSTLFDGFKSDRLRVFETEQLRRNPNMGDVAWEVKVAKRLLSTHFPVGALLHHQWGYYEHTQEQDMAGALIRIYQPVASSENKLPPLITFAGTRPLEWRSVWDDLQPNIGTQGVEANMEEIYSFFSKCRWTEQVWLLGFSLGGAQVQRVAARCITQVGKVTTVCSPGVDKNTYETFAQAIKHRKTAALPQMHLRHLVEIDDNVSDAGDGHIGLNCERRDVLLEHFTLSPRALTYGRHWEERPPPPQGHMRRIIGVAASLSGPHLRETTALSEYWIYKENNEKEPNSLNILLDNQSYRPGLEETRQAVALGLRRAHTSLSALTQRTPPVIAAT